MSADPSEELLEQKSREVFRAAKDGKAEEIKSILQDLPPEHAIATLHKPISQTFYPMQMTCCTALGAAAYYGHGEVVRLLIEDYKVNIDQTVEGVGIYTPLGAAVLGRRLDMVQYLVTHGCDINATNTEGRTAILLACQGGTMDIAKHLLQAGASLESRDKYGQTCLMRACYKDDFSMAQWLLECGADANIRNTEGDTALHIAAKMNYVPLAQLLLQHGAAIVADKDGCTPAIRAAVEGSCDVTDFFVELPEVSKEEKIHCLELLGAAVFDLDKSFSYLHRALMERYGDPSQAIPKPALQLPVSSHLRESVSLEELEERKSAHDLLHLERLAAVQRILSLNNRWAWKLFLDFAKEQAEEGKYDTALALFMHYATSGEDLSLDIFWMYLSDFLDILCDLFCNDVKPPFADVKKIFEFILRKLHGNKEKVKMLTVDYRCCSRASCLCCLVSCVALDPDLEEGTPLRELALSLVRLSFLLGYSHSLLHTAISDIRFCYQEYVQLGEDLPYVALVRFLLQCGLDPNLKNNCGQTPLHMLAETSGSDHTPEYLRWWVQMTRLLLEAGALPGVRNKDGKTAMQLAAASSVRDVIRKFLPSSLQSLAAVAVLKSNIAFQSEVSPYLAAFVEQH